LGGDLSKYLAPQRSQDETQDLLIAVVPLGKLWVGNESALPGAVFPYDLFGRGGWGTSELAFHTDKNMPTVPN
jgi:hypothetical protein